MTALLGLLLCKLINITEEIKVAKMFSIVISQWPTLSSVAAGSYSRDDSGISSGICSIIPWSVQEICGISTDDDATGTQQRL